ncbi:MAG: hypothetical protein ACYDHH_05890 [Solirubrobacteraceae bacterium]
MTTTSGEPLRWDNAYLDQESAGTSHNSAGLHPATPPPDHDEGPSWLGDGWPGAEAGAEAEAA